MAAFTYRAVDDGGQTRRGVIEASSAPAARRLLRERRLVPLAVTTGAAPHRLSLRRRVGTRSLAGLTRQLATLVGTGIRVEEALRLVAADGASPAVAALLMGVRGAILDGRSFAAALAMQPGFPDFYRASVAAGEASGRLGEVLGHLADFVENRQRAASRLHLALLYPALLAAVSLTMMTLLLVYVVPDIVRVFVNRGAALPLLTRLLIGLSGFVTTWGLGLVALAAGIGWGARRWLAVPANRLHVDRQLATRRPFAGLSRQINAARFAASLATLVASDVPLVEAIATAAAVTPNRFVRAQALAVAARVREGTSLRRAMAGAQVFPPLLVAIVASGEASGRLGPVLSRAAADLQRDLDSLVATLMGLIEPAVLLIMGGIVLLMVLAILLPIIDLNNLAGM